MKIGQKVIIEVKLELVCERGERTAKAVKLICEHARTGQKHAGRIYVTGLIERAAIV